MTSDVPEGMLLCTSCGLCCTGALHDVAVLDEEEEAAAAALGLEVLKRVFSLPCTRLEGSRCAIYLQRPKVCGRYRCRLLQDVEAGRVPLTQAMAKVKTATDLLAKALAHLPPGAALVEGRRELLPKAEACSGSPEARLHLTALTTYLDRHFRHAAEGRLLKTSAVPTTGDRP